MPLMVIASIYSWKVPCISRVEVVIPFGVVFSFFALVPVEGYQRAPYSKRPVFYFALLWCARYLGEDKSDPRVVYMRTAASLIG